MNLKSSIADVMINEERSITSNFVDDYTFVDMTVCFEIEIDNKIRYFVMQNGLTYHMNNYDLPRNELAPSVDGGGDEYLAALYAVDFDDKNDVEYFFENHDYYSEAEAREIHDFLRSIKTDPHFYI